MVIESTISPALKLGLRFIGAWPDMPYAIVIKIIYMFFSVVIQFFLFWYTISLFKFGKLQDLVDIFPITVHYTLSVIKLLTLWTNRRVIRKILGSMDSDWYECMKVDRHLYLVTAKASIAHFCCNFIVSFNLSVAVFFLLGDNAIALLHSEEAANSTLKPYPLKLKFPFVEAEQSPVYELIVIVLFLHGMAHTYTISVISMLIFSLVLHISGQIDIISEEIKLIFEEPFYYGSFDYKLRMLVERHNKVITLSDNINKLFSLLTLVQIFLNTTVICFVGLFLITSLDENRIVLIKMVFSYCIIMMEIFVYCFAGEYISSKSKLFADAVYNSLWYNVPSYQSKDVLFIIMRSQKQLTLKVGKMKNLSLEVFTSIMKASASYVSVLHAMY